MKTLQDLAKISTNLRGLPTVLTAKLEFNIDGNTFKAYEVTIAHCDLLFFCDIGTVNYLVDRYGDNNIVVLHDYTLDSEEN